MTDTYPNQYLYKRVVQAKLFIDEHLCEKIALDNIADEACFSKFHFIRLFKSIYGLTPHQYLVKVRIEKAKALLQQNVPVWETCMQLGFESVSSFTGLFKRAVKITPTQYRQHYLQRQDQIKHAPLQFVPNCFAEQKGWNRNFEEVR
jgi:AraC-like DNA-binding protein